MSPATDTYVVNGLCQNCKDTACAKVCPVECFYEPKKPDPTNEPNLFPTGLPDQLYIRPDECINCDACVPECPWEAITSGDDVPDIFLNFIALNLRAQLEPQLFKPSIQVDWKICPQCQAKTNTGTPVCQCNVVLNRYSPSTDE